jgi:methanogenic corrinoid protein MtbC1
MEAGRGVLDNAASPDAPADTPPDASVGPLDEIVGDYVALIRQGDSAAAMALVIEAIRGDRLSVPDALDGVLNRALREFGRMWHANLVTVAEEHFATLTSSRLLEQILFTAPKPAARDRTVMLTMVEGDAHDLGLRIVAAFFELDGWRTICLGANTPSEDLSLAAERFDADLVVVGATLNTQRAAAAQTIEVLRRSRPDQKIIVGGPAFSELQQPGAGMGADGCVLAPRDAVRLGRELLAEG